MVMVSELEATLAGYVDELVTACTAQTAQLQQLVAFCTALDTRLSRLEAQLAPFGISTRTP
jgi:uncharacterized protein YcgI (DUF1989 family)